MQFTNTTIGMTIAKSTFHVARLSRSGRVSDSVQLKRQKVFGYFAGIKPCKVVMEVCGGAHYWGRQLLGHDHDVVLLPAHKVKPYVQSEKNDRNDAVALKSVNQQGSCDAGETALPGGATTHVKARGKAALYQLIESVVTIDYDGVLCTNDELTGMFLMTLSYEYQ